MSLTHPERMFGPEDVQSSAELKAVTPPFLYLELTWTFASIADLCPHFMFRGFGDLLSSASFLLLLPKMKPC